MPQSNGVILLLQELTFKNGDVLIVVKEISEVCCTAMNMA